MEKAEITFTKEDVSIAVRCLNNFKEKIENFEKKASSIFNVRLVDELGSKPTISYYKQGCEIPNMAKPDYFFEKVNKDVLNEAIIDYLYKSKMFLEENALFMNKKEISEAQQLIDLAKQLRTKIQED